MATSLAEQLKRLAIPQTSALTDSKKRPSLLFEAKEAASISRDALFEIGQSGLSELISLDPNFEPFQSNLFSSDSKQLQRIVASKEVNRKLDKQITKFLIRLNPFVLLKPSHKALEWLIYRYHIHEYNVNDVICLMLPYYETNIFVKVLQLIDFKVQQNRSWAWLEHFALSGHQVTRPILINQVATDTGFLRLLCDYSFKCVKEHMKTKTESKLRAQLGLFITSLIGVLHRGPITDNVLTVMLPSLIESLKNPAEDVKSSGLMICGELFANNQLSTKLIQEFFQIILNMSGLNRERTFLLLFLYQTQQSRPVLAPEMIEKLVAVITVLKELKDRNIFMGPFIYELTKFLMNEVVKSESVNAIAQSSLWLLLDEIPCDLHHAKLIVFLLSGYFEKKKPAIKNADAHQWLKVLLEHFCASYAHLFSSDKDLEFQNIFKKWCTVGGFKFDPVIVSLVKKCVGSEKNNVWPVLKPHLLDNIGELKVFNVLCKTSPSNDYLVLLIWIYRLIKGDETNRAIKLKKMFEKYANYDLGKNEHFLGILSLLKNDENLPIDKAIEDYFLSSDYDLNLEAWCNAIEELKKLEAIAPGNRVWPLSIKVLIRFVLKNPRTEFYVNILSTIHSLENFKYRQQLEVLSYSISLLSKKKVKASSGWDLSEVNSYESMLKWMRVRMFHLMVMGLYSANQFKDQFSALILKFFENCLADFSDGIRFIAAVCAGCPFARPDLPAALQISPELQIYSLYRAFSQLKLAGQTGVDHLYPEYETLASYIIVALGSNSSAVRKAALKVLHIINEIFVSYKGVQFPFAVLFEHLFKRSEEIIDDIDQLIVSLFCLLSPDESVQGNHNREMGQSLATARECLLKIIVNDKVPLYITARLSQLLENVNSIEIMNILTKNGERALKFDQEESSKGVLTSFWQRFHAKTAKALCESEVWTFAVNCLSHDKFGALCFVRQINKEIWDALPCKKQYELFEKLIKTRAETKNDLVASAVANAVRKINLDAYFAEKLLIEMITNLPKDLSENSTFILENPQWKRGVALLELIQNKKKLKSPNCLLEPLFNILKFCLDQAEQSIFEYAKQLSLGSLLDICNRLSNELKESECYERILNVELIVQCLRASSNPQTHHHALLLLSTLGAIIPNQVMHNIMAIFTFMGSSVARLDDEHSVQVVTKVVDTIVPVLIEHWDVRGKSNIVAEVLRIFVWTLKDVPQHRRNPLFGRLIATLGPERSLWVFLLLLFENHVLNGVIEKPKDNLPVSLLLGLELSLAFGCFTALSTALNLIKYLVKIPIKKMNPGSLRDTNLVNKDGLFDVEKHTPKELRHFTYTLITFLNTLLSDNSLIVQVSELEKHETEDEEREKSLQTIFKEAISLLLKFIPLCTIQSETQQTKFWKAMVHHSYDVIDRLVSLISSETLSGVVRGLIETPSPSLCRKGIDLLNVHIQSRRAAFNEDEKHSLRRLVEPILCLSCNEKKQENFELVQQSALLALRLLAKVLVVDNVSLFKKVMGKATELVRSKDCHVLVFASATLTIADLAGLLKAHSIPELPKFFPEILNALAKYEKSTLEVPDMLLLSLVTSVYRLIDVLSQFLSPYVEKLLLITSIISTKWSDAVDLNKKLALIKHKLATSIPYRFLIPAMNKCYNNLIDKKQYSAIGILLSLLAESFSQAVDVSKLLPDLTPFIITSLQFRSSADESVSEETIDLVEGNAIEAILPLVLKLSEISFKPFYYQIFHWSSEHPLRSITFYRLSHHLAEQLKGLFVLFAGHFIQNAATLLDATNINKTPKGYYGDTDRDIKLLEFILNTLNTVFLYDSTDSANFLSKEKFQLLVNPVIDQLENPLGGIEALQSRTERLLTPCIAQMTLSVEDTQWKVLNYQLLMKTRSTVPIVRIGALKTVVEMAAKLGEDYLSLLPETIGSLAELLEDEDERVEEAMRNALRRMEDVLGQPITDYFK